VMAKNGQANVIANQYSLPNFWNGTLQGRYTGFETFRWSEENWKEKERASHKISKQKKLKQLCFFSFSDRNEV